MRRWGWLVLALMFILQVGCRQVEGISDVSTAISTSASTSSRTQTSVYSSSNPSPSSSASSQSMPPAPRPGTVSTTWGDYIVMPQPQPDGELRKVRDVYPLSNGCALYLVWDEKAQTNILMKYSAYDNTWLEIDTLDNVEWLDDVIVDSKGNYAVIYTQYEDSENGTADLVIYKSDRVVKRFSFGMPGMYPAVSISPNLQCIAWHYWMVEPFLKSEVYVYDWGSEYPYTIPEVFLPEDEERDCDLARLDYYWVPDSSGLVIVRYEGFGQDEHIYYHNTQTRDTKQIEVGLFSDLTFSRDSRHLYLFQAKESYQKLEWELGDKYRRYEDGPHIQKINLDTTKSSTIVSIGPDEDRIIVSYAVENHDYNQYCFFTDYTSDTSALWCYEENGVSIVCDLDTMDTASFGDFGVHEFRFISEDRSLLQVYDEEIKEFVFLVRR